MTQQKKMYKVLYPMDKKGGGTYWMRIGTAFTNRDDSLNVYLDAMPAPSVKSQRFEFQIRELDAEDLRRREAFATSSANASSPMSPRDYGGIGAGPTLASEPYSSRAVTAKSADGEGVPF